MTQRPASTDGFAPGERIGNYAVELELARGPSGIVYRAAHVVLPRRVTIRVMHAVQIWLRPIAIQMMREACFLEAMQHGGAPRVFECGMLADRRAWIATDAIDGTWLAEIMARGPLAGEAVAALVRDVAEILAHAHRRGIVCGGVRPDAIVYAAGRAFPVCLVDWSDARAHDATTAIPHVAKPAARPYAAPELTRGQGIDDRADVYALGAIAYHALTGQLPVAGAHVPVLQRCANVSPVLAALIDQMLGAHAAERPNAGEVRAAAELALTPPPAALPPLRLGKLAAGTGNASVPPPTPVRLPRFSSPRWTPPIGSITSDQAAAVVGEIAARASTKPSD